MPVSSSHPADTPQPPLPGALPPIDTRGLRLGGPFAPCAGQTRADDHAMALPQLRLPEPTIALTPPPELNLETHQIKPAAPIPIAAAAPFTGAPASPYKALPAQVPNKAPAAPAAPATKRPKASRPPRQQPLFYLPRLPKLRLPKLAKVVQLPAVRQQRKALVLWLSRLKKERALLKRTRHKKPYRRSPYHHYL